MLMLFLNCILQIVCANRDFAVKINDKLVSYDEFAVYKEYADFANKDNVSDLGRESVKIIVSVYAAVRYAEESGIEYEYTDKQRAWQLYGIIKEKTNVSSETVKNVCENIALYEKVYAFITDNYEMSDKDFQDYFDKYCEENKQKLNKISISLIFVSSKTNDVSYAEEIYGKALDNYDFDKLAQKYSDKDEYKYDDVRDSSLDKNIINSVYNMKEGDISMLETDKGFYIIKAENVETVFLENIKKEVRENFVKKRKDEIYSAQNDKWLENDIIEKSDSI